MKDDLQFLRLFDLYAPLLTATQREITELYFNFDLSLGEIAEQKGVSRQSVSDCLAKSRKQLQGYEEKLNFCKMLDDVSGEYSAYMTTVERWINEQGTKEANTLRQRLDEVHREFGVERIELDEGAVVGKTLQDEE